MYGGVRGRGGRLLLDQHLLLLLEQGELAEHLLLRDAAHEARHLVRVRVRVRCKGTILTRARVRALLLRVCEGVRGHEGA